MSIRVGHIYRIEDETGVSGTGRVAEFIEFTDGVVVVHWSSHTPSTNIYHNMKQVEAIHGHGGKTRLVTLWEEPGPDAASQEGAAPRAPVKEKTKRTSRSSGTSKGTAKKGSG